MPSNYTEHCQLSLWERADKVLMEDFNADNAKLDAALAGQAATLTAHATALNKLGNCEIVHFTYTGTNQVGSSYPTRISFTKAPMLFIVLCEGMTLGFGSKYSSYCVVCTPTQLIAPSASWSGGQVSIIARGSTALPRDQLNDARLHHVFAFYDQNEA